MIPNAETLKSLRENRHISISKVAEISQVDSEVILQWENDEEVKIGKGELGRLAKALNVPQYAILSEDYEDDLPDVMDFRTNRTTHATLDAVKGNTVRFLSEVQDYIKYIASQTEGDDWLNINYLPDLSGISPEQAAQSFVANTGLRPELLAKAPYDFNSYELVRRVVERHGISVIHKSVQDDSLKGACLYDKDGTSHIIWINTFKQNAKSRIFSLLHEVGHILCGHSGLSSTFEIVNELEAHCNKFAANVLLPRREFSSAVTRLLNRYDAESNELVNALSKEFVASKHAIVVRLVELDFCGGRFISNWLAQFEGQLRPEEETGGGSSANRDEGRLKLSSFGFRLAEAVSAGLSSGTTSPLEVHDVINLKPRYLDDWLSAASDRTDFVEEIENA